ncbi:hypothetical protein CRG98_018446 [Punica granatum]|uniref:G-patch domain-containing protein n=1 Tax=Punica granatum TaxID=22663 RepID=A0A2I0K096_PUNGR|nr:hypothetical protein CRG98_018446 [Punica granatum]
MHSAYCSGGLGSIPLAPSLLLYTKRSNSSSMTTSLPSMIKKTMPSTRRRSSPTSALGTIRTSISIIRDYEEVGPSLANQMIGKVLLRQNYVPGTGLGAQRQGILHPIKVEEYKSKRGLGLRPSYPDVIQARKGQHLATQNGKISSGILSQPIHFGEGLNEDGRVTEIKESLHCLEDHQLTVEPIEEINVSTEEQLRTLKIGTGLDPIQRARMINFLKEYEEVFAWSYSDMPRLDPSIIKHFLPLDTKRFQPK